MKDNIKNIREKILDNLSILKNNLERCEEAGLEDLDETIYNEIITLEEETRESDDFLEFSNIITNAQTIENKIDSFYSSLGISTIELNWPLI